MLRGSLEDSRAGGCFKIPLIIFVSSCANESLDGENKLYNNDGV